MSFAWPSVDIGATGICGVAIESLAAAGTYVAPLKFFPILSESLAYNTENLKRRSMRGIADIIGEVPGRTHIMGDISFELTEDVLPYFMYCMRATVVKTGTTPNWIYTATPENGAVPNAWNGRTLSVTVVRNGFPFGYTGLVVSELELDASDNGIVTCKATMVGQTEAAESAPTPTFEEVVPFGPGTFNIQIPTSTEVFDMDKFTFTVNDAATAQWRLQTVRSPSYISFGERTTTYKTERDFSSRDEYDNYYKLALSESGLTVLLTKGADNQVEFVLPKPQPDTFDVGQLTGQGTLIRSSVSYDAIYDTGTSEAYSMVCKCQELVTLPA